MTWTIVLRNTSCKKIWQNASRNMSENKHPIAENVASASTAEKVASTSANDLARNMVHVSNWNKKILVFAKKYKTTAEVPNTLPYSVLTNARDRARVKSANILMALTLVGCLMMVFSGKKAAERGESVSKMNLDWHRDYNEAAKREEEAAKKLHT